MGYKGNDRILYQNDCLSLVCTNKAQCLILFAIAVNTTELYVSRQIKMHFCEYDNKELYYIVHKHLFIVR